METNFEQVKESDNKIYKIKIYIEGNKILIEIESESKQYINSYEFEQLKVFPYFNNAGNLQNAFQDLEDLFETKYSLTQTMHNIELIFPRKRGDIKFLLKEIEENMNIKYERLSQTMKNIIDNNQLILGIDLGTTSCCASVMIDNDIIMIRNSLGSKQTPSFIYFIDKNKIYVGALAKLLPSNEKNIIYHVKKFIGKSYKEEEIEELKKDYPYNFKKDSETDLLKIEFLLNKEIAKEEDEAKKENEIINMVGEKEIINIKEGNDIIKINEGNEIINIKVENKRKLINEDNEIKEENEFKLLHDEIEENEIKEEKGIKEENEIKEEIIQEEKEEFYPEQIYSLILKKIIIDSEYYLTKYFGKDIKINNAVITVPAYFNQKQREATLNAAKIIGLNVITMINEPTAAILSYAYEKKESVDKHIVVIDFGGGTLDITLLKFLKDEDDVFCDILTTYGDTNFGGEDFDKILMDKCKEICIRNNANSKTIFEFDKNMVYNNRLKRACERAKIKLSYLDSTKINIENYFNYESINVSITRRKFLEYSRKLFNKFELILDQFISLSEIRQKNIGIDEVILIGGTTLMPKIKEIINSKFRESVIKDDLNPKEVVSIGAAIRGAIYLKLPPVKNIKLFDVTNLSLGIREYGDTFKRVIKRNSKIPCQGIELFKTARDNQASVLVEIYEGEAEKECKERNLFLGKFRLSNLTEKKAGESKIKVQFRINENSILEVSAWERDNKSNSFNSIKIKKPYELDIEGLNKRSNEFSFFESKEYNKIKNSIIEFEEELNIPNNNNFENKKIIFKNNIDKIEKFLLRIEKPSNLYISFIKYYFNKLCEFYQLFNSNINQDDLNDLNINKENLKAILLNVQFYNPDLIYEIIEEFVDSDDLYKSCVEIILKGYWDKLNLMFYLSKTVMKEKLIAEYKNVRKELSEANEFANICLEIIKIYKKTLDIKIPFTEKDLDDIILKIGVRKEIIKVRTKKLMRQSISDEKRSSLSIIFQKYKTSNIYEIEDLKELGSIVGENVLESEDKREIEMFKFDKEFEKARIFLRWIEEKNALNRINNEELYCILRKILTDYPYCSNSEEEKDKMWNEFDSCKEKRKPLNNYALKLKDRYTNLRSKISEEDYIKYDIYNGIILLLSRF